VNDAEFLDDDEVVEVFFFCWDGEDLDSAGEAFSEVIKVRAPDAAAA